MFEVGVALVGFQGGKIDVLGVEHALQFLEGQDKVDLGAHTAARGLELLGRAGTDKDYARIRMFLLHEAGGYDHGREGHGDVLLELREELLGHDAPGGAAGGAHEVEARGDVIEEVVRLLDGAEVRADGYLYGIGEAEYSHGLLELAGGGLLAELADKGRGDAGDYLVALVYGLDELEYLALVRDGREGAVDEAHAAGYALVVIYFGAALLIGADCVHAAGLGTGALDAADGVVGALREAAAAFDAFGLVDGALAIPADNNGALGANVHAGVAQAALTVG